MGVHSQEIILRPNRTAEPSEEWKLVLQTGFQGGHRVCVGNKRLGTAFQDSRRESRYMK